MTECQTEGQRVNSAKLRIWGPSVPRCIIQPSMACQPGAALQLEPHMRFVLRRAAPVRGTLACISSQKQLSTKNISLTSRQRAPEYKRIKQHSQQQTQQSQQQAQPAHSNNVQRHDVQESIKLLLSGAMSAVVSRTFVAPLERIKMEQVLGQNIGGSLQTAAQVLRTEGVAGFWKGNLLNLLRTAPFKAVNFTSFDMLHRALIQVSGVDGNTERFLAGALAGITATLMCFPLDVVRTRLLSRTRGPHYGHGPFSTLAGMLRHEGVGALYTGCLPAVIGMAPAGAVFYGVYDLLKHRHLMALDVKEGWVGGAVLGSPGRHHLPPVYTLAYGAIAGAASEMIVYPLEVIRRRMQMQSMALAAATAAAAASGATHSLRTAAVSAGGLAGLVAMCVAIYKSGGLAGFYPGLGPNMLQVLPSAALSYYTYDTLKQLLGVPE